jgi:hypothetical protein
LEFDEEIKRLNHLKGIIYNHQEANIQLTPHNINKLKSTDLSKEEYLMLQGYLLHILQFGTPEERLKILSGIQTRFELTQKQLIRVTT